MKVFITHIGDDIQVASRAEGREIVGDLIEVVRPGQSFLGHPHEWWATLEDGEHEIA